MHYYVHHEGRGHMLLVECRNEVTPSSIIELNHVQHYSKNFITHTWSGLMFINIEALCMKVSVFGVEECVL